MTLTVIFRRWLILGLLIYKDDKVSSKILKPFSLFSFAVFFWVELKARKWRC